VSPRSGPTKERLLDEAESLFARQGVQGVTTRELTEAADQRNASAVSYHFGSREGLLLELLARRGGPVDSERGERRAALGPQPPLRELAACLVEPYAALLATPGGRSYLRIVAQLRGRFAAWRVESDVATTRNLSPILDELESRPKASEAVRRERLVAMIMLLTAATAERARLIDDGGTPALSHDAFVANLLDMCTAVLSA
jgi:TetR/AcrR family transcriptional regulator, regulator of cefoperazone and chloramphenicol sensitivity